MLKNVAGQFVGVQMVSASDGTAFSGTVTVYVTVDNGTQTVGSVGSGVCAHKGNGLHNYAPSQAETNGSSIQFTFIGTGAIPQTIQLETLPTTGVLAPTVANRTIAVSATTGKVTAEAVELDPAARVKLDATQPDYAPLKSSDYTAPANSDISAVRAKTDNLPSDPADQSLVIDATNAVMARLGSPAGASVSADIAAVKTDTGNLVTRITSTLFSGITSLSRWLGALAGKTADTTTRAEINATTAGAGYNETTDSQEAIRDRGDAAWTTGAGGGGGGTTTIVTLQAAAGISPGVIVGPSEPLVIGDDYLTVMNRSVRINLLDANGDPAEVEYGTYALDDAGISIQMLLAKSGKPSVEALIVGTCTFFPAVGSVSPYLIVEFTKTETAKAIPGPYDIQVEAVWNDGKTVTFAPYGQIEFTRNIGRRT